MKNNAILCVHFSFRNLHDVVFVMLRFLSLLSACLNNLNRNTEYKLEIGVQSFPQTLLGAVLYLHNESEINPLFH